MEREALAVAGVNEFGMKLREVKSIIFFENIKTGFWLLSLFVVCFFSLNSRATILSDLHLGLLRPALQDSIYDESSMDPFRVLGNPAWATQESTVAFSTSLMGAGMKTYAAAEETSQLISFVYQERRGRWSFGAFSVLPTSTQPVLDTGSELERSSPWMNMTRQISYAANVSRHWDRLSLGLLLPVYFNASAEARTNLAAADVNTRAKVFLKPALNYGIGARYKLNSKSDLSFSYKEQASAKTEAVFEGNIPLLSLELLFEGESSYAFDPRRLSFAFSRKTSFGFIGARLRFSQWSKFSTPYIVLTNSSLTLVDKSPDGSPKNAWDGLISGLWNISSASKLAVSIGYQESPFSQISSYYDSDQLKLALAYSHRFAGEWSLAGHIRYHLLNRGVSYTLAGLGFGYRI